MADGWDSKGGYCRDLRHVPVYDDHVEQWRCLRCGHCVVVATKMDLAGVEPDSRVGLHIETWACHEEKDEFGVLWAKALQAIARETEHEELLGQDTSWPILDVIEKLTAAVDHLLADHACDQHGYEVVQGARKAAGEWLEKLKKSKQACDEAWEAVKDKPMDEKLTCEPPV
jgi:hypothetical protein